MLSVTLTGFFTAFSLILAIGAQNAFVLRQGLRGEHVGLVVAICITADAILIMMGVLGVGVLISAVPWLITAARYGGALFLTWYGLSALWKALKPGRMLVSQAPPASARRVAAQALAITWLNPHVYLDTVLLLGSIANSHHTPGKWYFAVGAVTASFTFFILLGFAARLVAPLFARERAWQALDVLVGVTMLTIAGLLVVG